MRRDERTQIQHRRLAAWLQGWQLTQRLDALPEPADGAEPPAPPPPYPSADARSGQAKSCRIGDPSRLAAGGIVLLPPETEATRRRPVYVAVIDAVHDGAWRVVPFGRLPVPAVPGELATGRRQTSLQVLCVWNVGSVEGGALVRGWLVGRLTVHEMRWARQLLGLQPGAKPASALALRLGPPLLHPLDPRHDYLEQERLLWLPTAAPTRCGEGPAPYGRASDQPLPLAAEKREAYDDKP